MDNPEFKPGIYQHFKGMKYLALSLARHSETLEWMVVYIPLYENENAKMWIRPLAMFNETVEKDGQQVPRFTYLSAS